jgi:hypothetical protein
MKILMLASLFVYGQLASAFTVLHPDGLVDVQPTGHGFNVIDMRTHEITTVNETASGYVITPQGEPSTFINMSPMEKEGLGRDTVEESIILPTILDDDKF